MPDDNKSLPLGYATSKIDWDRFHFAEKDRPYSLENWNQLTLGEQVRYSARELQAAGLVADVQVNSHEVTVKLSLPATISNQEFSAKEVAWLQAALQKQLLDTLHWMITMRRTNDRKY